MSTIHTLLNEFSQAARTNRDKGDLLERFIAKYLLTDPMYADRLSDVWLWSDWPLRWGGDDGIDIVARERDTGDYWAIQCKFFDPEYIIQKSDIDSFFTASGKIFVDGDVERSFVLRLIVSTTDKWSSMAEEALSNQTIDTSRLRVQDLADRPIDWSQFSLANITDIRLRDRKKLLPHQQDALEATKLGFISYDRGKLIMACGTGKTFTSLRIAEDITPKNGRILFLAPSISLVSQSLREWTAEAADPINSFVVCSDSKVGKENEDIRAHDLAYPPTTNAQKLANAARWVSNKRRSVVFSTYQSIQVISDAQRLGLGEFDLIICDEAHRTTGIALGDEEDKDISDFVKVHEQHIIRGKKRLYMTATPRIYNDKSKDKANENSATLYSMDDVSTYGPELFRLGFGKSVQKGLYTQLSYA
jgi:predicted helicase